MRNEIQSVDEMLRQLGRFYTVQLMGNPMQPISQFMAPPLQVYEPYTTFIITRVIAHRILLQQLSRVVNVPEFVPPAIP